MRTTTPPRSALRRLVLRPGTHVLRRSASELQVGLHPSRAVVVADRPEVRALLDALTSPAAAPVGDEYDGRTLAALADSGLLMDVDALLPLAPAPPGHTRAGGPRVSWTGVAALAAEAGDEAAALAASRSSAEVQVATFGSSEAVSVADGVVALLSDAGLRTRLLQHGRLPGKAAPEDGASGETGLLVAVGEPPREAVDVWLRAGTPHLLLRLTEGHAVVGPFVVPGTTACLRCVDAHHTDLDPAWPLLLTQYARAVTREREDTLPEPVDTMLATLAGAWAARELVSHAEGRVPATSSATVRLDPRLTALETQRWPRHPACGCAWA